MIVAVLGLFAATIRLLAARSAYPACGDAGHFVQHGVALANGVPGAMSSYWSQGMIVIAAVAVKLGLDPRYAMQLTTLVSGVAVVLLFLGVVWRLTGSRGLALVGGVILAVNPTMVQYSITGYSEMPYLALLMAGIWVGLSTTLNCFAKFGLAGALIGASGYFKGLDAAVAACGFGLYACLQGRARGLAQVLQAGIVPAAAFIVLLPLCIFTFVQDGSFTPGSKGGRAFLALGSDWADSKFVYAAEGMQLDERTTTEIASQLPKRVLLNFRDTLRIFSNQIYQKGFRIGTIWFSVIAVLTVLSLRQWKVRESLLPACMLLPQLFLLFLVLLHDRVLAPSLPWVVLLFLLAWRSCAPEGVGGKQTTVILLAVFLAVNARYAADAFANEFFWWRYVNIQKCAIALREIGGTDDDVVMAHGPSTAIEFNRTNPLKTVDVPYGTLEQIEKIALRKQVRYIVVSDAFRPHWPVARLFDDGVSAPENWILREELFFPEEEWTGWRGHPGERCRIYERLNQPEVLREGE